MEQALFVVFVVGSMGSTSAGERAALAYMNQTGIDKKLDAYSRTITTDQQRMLIGDTALIAKVLVDRQIVLKWTF